MASDARIERAANALAVEDGCVSLAGEDWEDQEAYRVLARAALDAAGPSEDEARLARERDEAREAAGHLRDSLERLTKAVHNWNVALEIDDAGEIYAVNCELEAAVIAADEQLGGGGQ